MTSLIQVTGLKKHYQMGGTTVRALDGVDIEIPAHTFTVVMGPSGSGKSSLLYLLGGLDRPTAGGEDPDEASGEDRFVLLGMSTALRVLLVCHCYREREAVIRIISARRADRAERADYERRWRR